MLNDDQGHLTDPDLIDTENFVWDIELKSIIACKRLIVKIEDRGCLDVALGLPLGKTYLRT